MPQSEDNWVHISVPVGLAVQRLCEKRGVMRRVELLEALVDYLCVAIADELDAGNSVRLQGVGTLEPRMHKATALKHVRTGQRIDVPERRVVRFRMASDLRARLNRNGE